ncbi:hypothetical protein WISP_141852 [Willisornis vidua]|uniref:Uncharacterized protein n=1 Tax=Willisornis vidua TaxID=1566151 RepID=A0ABQ9CLY0_9PASS|nr:hypothetical protein WISP_141852 [Willisornis vidua]
MFVRANASQGQDRLNTGQNRANQRWQQCLSDNIFNVEKSYFKEVIAAREERSNNRERNNSADIMVNGEEGGGCALGTGAEIPLQPVVQTVVEQAVTLEPMEVHGGCRDSPVEEPTTERRISKGGCDPEGSLSWSRVREEKRSPHWSRFAAKICDPVEDSCWRKRTPLPEGESTASNNV